MTFQEGYRVPKWSLEVYWSIQEMKAWDYNNWVINQAGPNSQVYNKDKLYPTLFRHLRLLFVHLLLLTQYFDASVLWPSSVIMKETSFPRKRFQWLNNFNFFEKKLKFKVFGKDKLCWQFCLCLSVHSFLSRFILCKIRN